jgi:hypothetical protein
LVLYYTIKFADESTQHAKINIFGYDQLEDVPKGSFKVIYGLIKEDADLENNEPIQQAHDQAVDQLKQWMDDTIATTKARTQEQHAMLKKAGYWQAGFMFNQAFLNNYNSEVKSSAKEMVDQTYDLAKYELDYMFDPHALSQKLAEDGVIAADDAEKIMALKAKEALFSLIINFPKRYLSADSSLDIAGKTGTIKRLNTFTQDQGTVEKIESTLKTVKNDSNSVAKRIIAILAAD